jgi:hypothetical protein
MPKNCHPNIMKKQLATIALLATMAGQIAGCASNYDESVEIVGANGDKTQLTEAEIKQYLQEWHDAKPGIERLTELESDLAFLIAEVSRMSDLNNTPEKYASASDADMLGDEVISGDNVIVATLPSPYGNTSAASTNASLANSNVKPNAAAEGGTEATGASSTAYAVHVASFLKPQSANFGWYVVQQEYPALMANLTPKLKQVSRPKQQLYSLRVGPFVTDSQANNACKILKRRNYKCELTTFDGNMLEL